MVDLGKYRSAKKKFIKLEGFTKPVVKEIEFIIDGKFDKPVLIFKDGTEFQLNKTNVDWLIDTFDSTDGEALVGQKVELYRSTIQYEGKPVETILLRLPEHEQAEAADAAAREKSKKLAETAKRAIAERTAAQKKPPGARDDMDDEIPF